VIDEGESVLEGIAREVREETGITVLEWAGLLYTVRVHAPDLGWTLGVEVWEAASTSGELCCGADPDGIVIGAEFHAPEAARSALDAAPRWVGEPLWHHIDPAPSEPRSERYAYSIHGHQLAELRVERVE
jgi:8-oxo-dGTP pyrophosphatase MutT (NUDIX family)